jgi:hypothetical protein
MKMQVYQMPWQAMAKAKVADTWSKIPREWILGREDLENAKKQRQLNGPFIESFLEEGELEIIRNDSVPLVEKIRSGQYTALQVARAYCKTTAIAHQIVRIKISEPQTKLNTVPPELLLVLTMILPRTTASTRSCSTKH